MPTVWRQVEGGLGATTVAHFLISKAEKLLQPLPPIELQEEFAAFVRQSDKSKFALQNAISAARETKRSIIADALGIKGKE